MDIPAPHIAFLSWARWRGIFPACTFLRELFADYALNFLYYMYLSVFPFKDGTVVIVVFVAHQQSRYVICTKTAMATWPSLFSWLGTGNPVSMCAFQDCSELSCFVISWRAISSHISCFLKWFVISVFIFSMLLSSLFIARVSSSSGEI